MIENLKFSTLKRQVQETTNRFPYLTLLFIASFVLLLMATQKEFLKYIGLTDVFFENAALILYSISIYAVPFALIAENLAIQRIKAASAAIVLGLITWQAQKLSSTPVQLQIALNISSLLLCSVAPFLKDKSNDRLCYYWYEAITAGFWTVIPCSLLALAICTLQFSLKTLFSIHFTDFVSALLYGGTSMMVAPLLFLGQLPKPEQLRGVLECQAPKPIKIILTWLLIPITLVFFFIIYAYFVKAAITQENVRGLLVSLIIGYSIFGIFVLLSSYPLIAEENKAARWLHKFFFAIILLPAVILIWRVYVRIQAYGLTVDRIFAAIFAIWLTITALAYAFRKIENRQLRFIPLSLSIITLLIYAGPWSPEAVALKNQKNRLIHSLSAENLYQDGHVVVKDPKPKISSIDNQKKIISGFNYLEKLRYSSTLKIEKQVDPLETFFKNTPLEKDFREGNYSYNSSSFGYSVLARLAVPIMDKKNAHQPTAYLNFFKDSAFAQGYPIKGYDVFFDLNVTYYSSPACKAVKIPFDLSNTGKTEPYNLEFSLNKFSSEAKLIIRKGKIAEKDKDECDKRNENVVDVITFKMKDAVSPYISREKSPETLQGLSLESTGKSFAAKLTIKNWSGSTSYPSDSKENNNSEPVTDSLNAYILLKKR